MSAQHSTAQHSTAQHSTAQHSTAQHSTAQHSTAQHSTAQHSKRIEYLDALRGFAMILVVVAHVANFNLGLFGVNSYHTFFRQFRMPLFFFVSGFVFYKRNFIWNLSNTKKFLSKKFLVQIISPFLFLLCYIHIKEIPFITSITDEFKSGYWFTFTLFNYFLLYIGASKILGKIGISEKNSLIILLFIGVILNFFWLKGYLMKIGFSFNILSILGMSQIAYFIFFVLGICIRKYFNYFEKFLDKSPLLIIATTLYFTLNIFVNIENLNNNYLAKIFNLLLAICGITITFAMFRKHEPFFASNNKVATTLKFIGKRTLDIYLLHYFFLSFNLPQIFSFFSKHNLPLPEFVVSIIMAAIIIAASLFVSCILRVNDSMAHFLFGARKPDK